VSDLLTPLNKVFLVNADLVDPDNSMASIMTQPFKGDSQTCGEPDDLPIANDGIPRSMSSPDVGQGFERLRVRCTWSCKGST
jgi:hypothetical protein